MKWLWTAVLAATVVTGCRSSQQPINPFIRTTVPPPGTGEGAVVVPGSPYYPGSTPTPSPQPMAPVVTTPVAPVPAQPAMPPTRDLKKGYPGGNYIYHQSSVDVQDTLGEGEQADADRVELAVNSADPGLLRLGGTSDAVRQALELSQNPTEVELARFEQYNGRLPGDTALEGVMRPARPLAEPTELNFSSQSEVSVRGAGKLKRGEGSPASLSPYDSSSLEGRGVRHDLA